jgi:hypothetical protein
MAEMLPLCAAPPLPESTLEQGALPVRAIMRAPGRRDDQSRWLPAAQLLPEGTCLTVMMECDAAGEAQSFASLDCPAATPGAPLIDRFGPSLFPGAGLGAAAWPPPRRRWQKLTPPIQGLPAGRGELPRPRPLAGLPSLPLVSDAAAWPWELGGALAAIAAAGGGSLIVEVRRENLAASEILALARVADAFQAQAYALPEAAAQLLPVAPRLRAMAAEKSALRLTCYVSLAQPADETIDLVRLALFGVGAPLPSWGEGGIDLRRLIGAEAGPKRLLPTDDEIAALRTAPPAAATRQPGDLLLGHTPHGAPVRCSARDRARHLWLLGGTGTGKSSLMRALMVQDMAAGEALILIDPHGDLSREIASAVPEDRRGDFILADAAEPAGAFRLDPLRAVRNPDTRDRAADALVHLFSSTLYHCDEAFGPMFDLYFRNALFLLAVAGGRAAKLTDMQRLFSDDAYRRSLLDACGDDHLLRFWREVAPHTSGDYALANFTPYVISKLTRLVATPQARRLFADQGPALDFPAVMAAGKILVLRCPKGILGEAAAGLATAVCLNEIAAAAMARADLAARRPVRLYVDEMQSCPGDALSTILAEGRKFGLTLTLANQSLSQIGGTSNGALGSAALANAGNLLLFRLGAPDALTLSPWLDHPERWRDLCNLPDYRCHARLLQDGRPVNLPLRLRTTQ